MQPQQGARFDGTIELHVTYDEEVGGAIGPQVELSRQEINRNRTMQFPPASPTASPPHTTAACISAVEVAGKSGHAAEPEKGIDALEAATGVLFDLYALRRTYAATTSTVPGIGSPTLVVGLIKGGINTNVVPDNVTFRIDRRIIPEESPAAVETALMGSIHRIVSIGSALAGRDRDGAPHSSGNTVCTHRRPGKTGRCFIAQRHGEAIIGREPLRTHGVPIYTDARHYTAAGVPTVLYGAGPRTLVEANGHRADERLVLDRLHKATAVVALALCDLLASRLDRDGERDGPASNRSAAHVRRSPGTRHFWRGRVCALGVAQIISWGVLFYTIAVLGAAMRPRDIGVGEIYLPVRQLHGRTFHLRSRVAAGRPPDRYAWRAACSLVAGLSVTRRPRLAWCSF